MPPESIWNQYPIVAVLVLATAIIAMAFYRLWKDLLKWFEEQDAKREAEREKQDAKREAEREKQRTWQAQQDEIRDRRWQEFLKTMQSTWIEQDGRHTQVLHRLDAKVDTLITSVNNHDVWARAKGEPS